jgi:formate hydrogenlyase subunit 3/multisubunit Na+/H+ antiporter MnhD subunit
MSAPLIWIFIPAVLAVILWLIPNERLVVWLGIGISLILALTARLLPLETPLSAGNWSIKISTTLTILGRHLILSSTDQPLLIFFFLSLCFWYICSAIAGASHKLIPYGLIIITLLISALAVEPFLYAALLIEIAVLVSIPLLKPAHHPPGRGLMRYIAFQTIAMPFILFSGWLLTGITAGPGELSFVSQAAIFLGLGFVFLLAIFPFNTWIPLLSEESHPSSTAFILWIFPTVGFLFGIYFMDTFSWIRESYYLSVVLRASGMIMIVSGGVWAAFQKNLKRMMAYAMIMETGYSLLALSIKGTIGVYLFFGLLIPRTLALFLWALALSIILNKNSSAQFASVKGLGRKYPFAATIIIFSHLSLTGLPLLAGFPIHQALWEQLGILSITGAIWYFVATIGLLMGGIRTLAVLVTPSSDEGFSTQENWPQRIFLSLGILILMITGIFPQWAAPLLSQLPSMFNHLGR